LHFFAVSANALPGGEIYTTNQSGQVVPGNLFAFKTEVYLTGGPEAASNCQGMGLPYGAYYFQVTSASGSHLLSPDTIEERRVFVAQGVIVKYFGRTHTLRPGGPCGSNLIQLMPFLDAPPPCNEYKVWMTPVERYDPAGSGFFGFDSRHSKTANFKVQCRQPQLQTVFSGHKFYDHNGDGVWNPQLDPLELPIGGWRVEIYKDGLLEDATFTDEDGKYMFIRDLDDSAYTFKEIAPGGFIGDNIPGAIWLAKTAREFTLTASAPAVAVPDFGNLSYERAVGLGRTKGFWHNQNGAAMMAATDPEWRDALTTWNGSPLCLRRKVSSYDPNVSIFAPLPLPASFATAHADFANWIVGSAGGHAGFILSTQVAAAVLNRRVGFMQFDAYIDRFQNGILVSFDDMVSGVQQNLLCHPGAGMTGPHDPEQALRTMMLGCINEFGSINNSGDPAAAQPVFAPRPTAAGFVTPYSN
jgi:hypothetical protein